MLLCVVIFSVFVCCYYECFCVMLFCMLLCVNLCDSFCKYCSTGAPRSHPIFHELRHFFYIGTAYCIACNTSDGYHGVFLNNFDFEPRWRMPESSA